MADQVDEADTQDEAWDLVRRVYAPILRRNGLAGELTLGVERNAADWATARGRTGGGAWRVMLYRAGER